MSTSLKAHSMILAVLRQSNPREDHRRQRVFAWAVTALVISRSAVVSQWLTVVAGPAKASSKLRRLVRWLSNPLVDVGAYYQPFIRAALSGWAGREVLLLLDSTSSKGACGVCRLSLCFRGRAVPLTWKACNVRSHSIGFATYVAVLEQAMALLPEGCTVTLLGDRGFGHRQLMRWCRRNGWHFVLRLKADSRVVLPDSRRLRLSTFRPQPQHLIHLPDVRLLASVGPSVGPLHVVAVLAPAPASEIWYLASDQPHPYAIVAQYRCRFHIEASIRDDKSGGWDWEASPLRDPLQVDRLCLVMAVATLYAVTEGTLLADADRRTEIDPHDTRGLSYFQIGCRQFQRLLAQGRRLRLRLRLSPIPDPQPVSAYGIPFPLFGSFTWLPASRPAGC